MTDSLRGKLVVATPFLGDPNFAHTVVFMIDHSGEGALGVVVNRPSGVEVGEALPRWEPLASRPRVMFVGGPVQPEAVVGLGNPEHSRDEVQPVAEGVGVVDLRADPLTLIGDLAGFRLFVGYAGWSEGQLEAEIDEGGWFVVDATPEDVFDEDPDALWVRVLERQGGMFHTVTPDPSQN